jgi:hypothetical protein
MGLCMLELFETADEDIMMLLNGGNCIPVDRECWIFMHWNTYRLSSSWLIFSKHIPFHFARCVGLEARKCWYICICVFPCILYINEQWCNTNKCTIFIKYDVLTMLPTCFGLNRPSSGQYFTEIPGNYNMSYIQLKCLLCVAVRNIKII